MNKETLRMQMLAGIITESQYKAELAEENGQFKSLDFGKLSTLFQMLVKIPANAGYNKYDMDTGKSTSGKEGIVGHEYVTPEFFKKLKDLQDGLQKGDKEAGEKFSKSFPLGRQRLFPFFLYQGEKDLFMPADYRTLDELNRAFDDVYRVAPYTSEYEDDDVDVVNPEWNNLVDTVNDIDLNDFKKYNKK